MTAEEFIDALEERSLVSPEAIGSLRQFVAKSLKIVTPESLAKLLVDKKWLTLAQAKQLLQPAKPPPAARPIDDEMMLAPLDDMPRKAPAAQAATAGKAPAKAKPPAAAAPVAKSPAKAAAGKSNGAGATEKAATAAKAATAGAKAVPAAKAKTGAGSPLPKLSDLDADVGFSLGGAGPLDDLLGAPAEGDSPAGFGGEALAPAAARRRSSSKLLWIAICGGTLAIVFIIALVVVLGRSNGDAEWAAAEKDFAGGADRDAIAKLDAFLEKFPTHPRAVSAAVYRGVARLRQSAASKRDWAATLTIAREVLPKAVENSDFVKARDSLAKILPDMAVGLARQAKEGNKKPREQRRQQAQAAAEALAMAKDPRYTPSTTKPWATLQAVENDVSPLVRDIDRQAELDRAAGEIRTAITAGDLAAAYTRRDRLLADWPELQGDGTLETLEGELAQSEMKSLKVDSTRHKAESKARPSPIVSTIVFGIREGKDAAGGQGGGATAPSNGPATAIFFRGTAYFIIASDGRLLGRAFLGFDSRRPQPVGASGKKEFLAFDAVHNELQRIAAPSARIIWRQPLGDALAGSAAIRQNKVYCATKSGKLLALDADSGDAILTAKLAEPLSVGPTLSSDGAAVYFATDRGNLLAISAPDFHVTGVTRLGHEQGIIVESPVEFGRFIVVVQRRSSSDSTLRILTGGSEGALRAVQEIPFTARIGSAPVAQGARLVVATVDGAITVFSASGPAHAPLTKVAEAPAPVTRELLPRYLAVDSDHLWVAGQGIAQYDLAGGGNLRPAWQTATEETAIAPPLLMSDKLIVAAADADGRPFAIVKALSTSDGKPAWELALGPPLAGIPLASADGKSVSVVHPLAGALSASIPRGGTQQIALASRAMLAGKPAPFAVQSIALPDGKAAVFAVAGGGDRPPDPRLLLADAKDHSLKALSSVGQIGSFPVLTDRGLLVADSAGQVLLLDPKSGERLATPYLMPLSPGHPLERSWSTAIPGKPEALLTDGGKRIFRVGLKDKSSTRLTALAEDSLAKPLDSQPAVLGQTAFAPDVDGEMAAINVTDLKTVKSFSLAGSVQSGPYRVGDSVLAATDRELFCFDGKPELTWKKPLPDGAPAQGFLQQGAEVVLASMTGTIWRVDLKTGDQHGKLGLDEPLTTAPVAVGKQLVVAAADGTLLFVQEK